MGEAALFVFLGLCPLATVYACQGPGDVGVRAVQVSRCCPWAAWAVRSPRIVFCGLVRRARLSGSIHFIKELNNHSRYCFFWHAVQGRMAADWRMVRVFRGYRGKPFAVHATPWCGAASTISALAEITGLQAGPGLGRSRGRAQPPGKPRTWRTARHSGSRRVTTPVWSGQGDFLLYGAIVRPGSVDRANSSCRRWGALRTWTGRSMVSRLARNRPHIPVTD